MTQPDPAPSPAEIERAVAALLALLRPAVKRMVTRRYGSVAVYMNKGQVVEIVERKTFPPGFNIYDQAAGE